MKILFITLTLIFLLACSNNKLPPGDRAGGFIFAEPKKNSQVIGAMKKKEIPFEINEKGMIIYLIENQAEVLGLVRKAKYGEILNDFVFESAVLTNDIERNKYVSAFEKNSIPYQLETNEGVVQIFWRQKFGPRVDMIRQSINQEIIAERKKNSKNIKDAEE